jgi:tetratricopeptide (TPR) repeat protein
MQCGIALPASIRYQNSYGVGRNISLNHIPLEAIILFRQALELSNKGNIELALAHLGKAVMIAPMFQKALCEMGYCYEKLDRYPEALSKFDHVLTINPSHNEAEMNRRRILEKMGRTGGAP